MERPTDHRLRMKRYTGAIVFILLAVLLFSYLFQAKKQNASMRGFQRVEVTALNILDIIEAYHNDQVRYPADLNELNGFIENSETELALNLRRDQIEMGYESTDSGKSFSINLWKKETPGFKLDCSAEKGCQWYPYLPYP